METQEEHLNPLTQPQERLGIAIARADFELLNDLLNNSTIDINALSGKYLPLEWLENSTKKEKVLIDVLELLLNKGADPLIENGIAIKSLLRRKKHSNLFIILINHLINQQVSLSEIFIEDMPLIFAVIQYGSIQDIEFLLDVFKKKLIIETILQQEYNQQTPLIFALDFQDIPVAHMLLQEGSNPYQTDSYETSVLHYIVRLNDIDFFNNFITLYNPDFLTTDSFGQTCLHEIAYFGSDKLIEHFLNENLDINQQDTDGNTPLLLTLKSLEEHIKKCQNQEQYEQKIKPFFDRCIFFVRKRCRCIIKKQKTSICFSHQQMLL